MDPIAFHIGPISVHWYGIFIVSGVLAATIVSTIEAKRRGENPDHVWNGLVLCLVLGIIGARLYHVFSTPQGGSLGWPHYRQHPMDIFKIWEGGLAIYGAVAGGILGLLIYVRWYRLSFWRWADIGAHGLLLAQAIGRWGNYVNQELYGPPTTLPWGIHIDAPHRFGEYLDLNRYPPDTRFHPVFLYESLWNLLGFIVLMYIARRWRSRLRDGDIFLGYFIWYSSGRFFIEMLRPDAWMLGPLAAAQVFALMTIALAVALIMVRHRRAVSPAGQDDTLS